MNSHRKPGPMHHPNDERNDADLQRAANQINSARADAINADDLIDAGLTPREAFKRDAYIRTQPHEVEAPHAPFLEAPYERAAHALLDAVGETAVAIWTAPSKEDVLTFRDTLESAIGNLMAQSVAAQTLADNWDERGNK